MVKQHKLLVKNFGIIWKKYKYLLILNVYGNLMDFLVNLKFKEIKVIYYKSRVLGKLFNKEDIVVSGKCLCLFFSSGGDLYKFTDIYLYNKKFKEKFIYYCFFRKGNYFFNEETIKSNNINVFNLLRIYLFSSLLKVIYISKVLLLKIILVRKLN